MARTWGKRLGFAVVLAAGAAGGYLYLEHAAVERTGTSETVAAAPVRAAPAARELAPIEVTQVEPAVMRELLRVSGELRPVNRAVLKTKVSGTVREVNARQGEAVEAGQVLIRFATEDLESAVVQRDSSLEAARAQLNLAEQTLAKTEELAGRGFATRAALEKAQSDVVAAKANVAGLSAQTDTARTALGDAEILAPFDGIVASRSVEPGEQVAASSELMTIVDTSVLEAEVLVSTRDIGRLAIGQTAELQVDGVEETAIFGTVDRINPVANEGSRFVPVHIRLDNSEGRLWGGMFATGAIHVREDKDILAVPPTALRQDEAGDYVLKISDGRLVRQSVELGPDWQGGSLVQINEGITAGDAVLAAPLPELKADTPVVVSSAG